MSLRGTTRTGRQAGIKWPYYHSQPAVALCSGETLMLFARRCSSVVFLAAGVLGCQRAGPATPMSDPTRTDAPEFAGSRAGDECEVAGIKLCWCPSGQFMMGSPPDEPERRLDEVQVEVTLTKGFWMGKHEVTQGQWKRVV